MIAAREVSWVKNKEEEEFLEEKKFAVPLSSFARLWKG
jgi:hypothetical protein